MKSKNKDLQEAFFAGINFFTILLFLLTTLLSASGYELSLSNRNNIETEIKTYSDGKTTYFYQDGVMWSQSNKITDIWYLKDHKE